MEHLKRAVFKNALIWAGNPIKKIQAGMSVRDGKIIQFMENDNTAAKQEGVVDLQGMHIIPGLIDAHRHFFVSALMAQNHDASKWRSKSDALGSIEAVCKESQSGSEWVCFAGMDYTAWDKMCMPVLKEIDAVSNGRPVLVADVTCHRGLVSSETLRKTGLNRKTLYQPKDMDTDLMGKPTGLIWEDAMAMVFGFVFRDMFDNYGEEWKNKIIIDEANDCMKMGLTHIHDPGLPWDVQMLLKDVQRSTPLKMSWSVTSYESICRAPGKDDDDNAVHSEHAPKSVKLYMDGANRTAASLPVIAGIKAMVKAYKKTFMGLNLNPMRAIFEQKIVLKNGRLTQPYLRFNDTEELTNKATFFADKGYRLVCHAVGNEAAMQAAAVINKVKPAGGASVEHLTMLTDDNLDMFASCGSVASVQPGFIPIYAHLMEDMCIMPYLKTFGLKSMIKRGVPICISSDVPCGPKDPLFNIRRAVDRKKSDGSTLDPDEAISQSEALAAGTIGGSLSVGNKNNGLNAGEPATFCVVDGDPFSDTSRVVQTWIDGIRVY